MYKTKLHKIDDSVMLAIPPAILESLRLHAGMAVDLIIDHGRLVIDPLFHRRYTLNELLAQCDTSAEIDHEDCAWLDDKPVDKELL